MDKVVRIDGNELKLTSLDKVMLAEGLTKAHLIDYYCRIATNILPHLYNRPIVMKRYPDGIEGEAFYQKECPDFAPQWIMRYPVKHSSKMVNYVVCNNMQTLLWLANLGCVEMHAWLARLENLESPDLAVMDLDPAEGATFRDTMEVALLVRGALEQFNLTCFPKTSGASGLHIFIPIKPVYPWQAVTAAMKFVAETVAGVYPDKATVERKIEKRAGKVYLDYLQNGRGKTMAFQYSLRPLPGAPVSTPLDWSEVEKGDIHPQDFNVKTIFTRVETQGDIYRGVLSRRQLLDELLKMV
ncbi:MAG: putative ATP-dependent DNA ligase YkoU [Pelotomaculum sp. PtaB.Bin013]|uniref:Non-homologous end-joining DNA ligase n=1 Tax=Pelotomaculum isophthalicicum JI TaxID=947010 RepID=A0A9X4H511_9FIRM|nr:non-homologous end-joining DNA ligase [Pelotomaculum isophthalicicum]MDF9407259.1 non-homologous end-joining DNA ligase [Pelotomaculum isophthalicicum JI]OPX92078.1 MAG: putative ATP-dependent DNA ligase YkoU [Pelotomaculum sp. PtaB.Bin013]